MHSFWEICKAEASGLSCKATFKLGLGEKDVSEAPRVYFWNNFSWEPAPSGFMQDNFFWFSSLDVCILLRALPPFSNGTGLVGSCKAVFCKLFNGYVSAPLTKFPV